jgi:hypothetical protein
MAIKKRTLGLTLLLLAAASAGKSREAEEKWIQLFNGRDLDGWTVKIAGYDAGDNFGDTFRVEDGVLKVAYDRYERFDGRFGHLFYQESFSHYRLRLEYRFVGEQCPGGPEWAFRNSGIMVHGQTVAAMDKGQDFPVSIEVQLLGGPATGSRPTANVCTPGTLIVLDGRPDTRHCIDSRSETYRGDQWVVVEVEVRGNELIRHIVGGETVLSYTKPRLDDGTPLGSGSISLQAESHPVEFRRVELLELVD